MKTKTFIKNGTIFSGEIKRINSIPVGEIKRFNSNPVSARGNVRAFLGFQIEIVDDNGWHLIAFDKSNKLNKNLEIVISNENSPTNVVTLQQILNHSPEEFDFVITTIRGAYNDPRCL
ncbi:hypothetical protein CUC15_03840 [Oceanobacillus zhaokaii]|uniref:Uncharacterized protein n=1 Tax=Oceanobacillus zhaokaii TaxID=2052660 RepID=A0A345PDR9_9BACI|nr:hypothetical protein [Oceanobacillus zhaokaii]AXI08149.1 hypothetical protein CUC15_03840 [Oceanobacillus zhaokaii]